MSEQVTRPRRALVTGGGGFLGAACVRALVGRGVEVRALVRSKDRAGRLAGLPVTLVEGDIAAVDFDVDGAVAGVDYVVHCAAATGIRKTRAECIAVNVDGTRRLLEAAARSGGFERFVHVSSLSVYGMKPGSFDEGSPLRKEGDPYGDTKVDAEDLCRAHGDALDVITIRPALILGPEDTGFFPMFVDMLARGRFPLLVRRPQQRSAATPPPHGGDASARVVFVDDVAELIARAIERAPRGATYNACAPGELSWRRFAELVCDAYGLKRPTFKLNAALLRPLLWTFARLERLGVPPPMRTAEVEFLSEERAYATSRAAQELAFTGMSADACVDRILPHFHPAPAVARVPRKQARA